MKKGTIWMTVGSLMIIAALGLTVYNCWQENHSQKLSAEIVKELAIEETEHVTDMELPDYERHPGMEMPSIEIDDNQYIGILKIPRYGLELPVMSDWNYQKLRVSPCRYKGSIYEGDLIVAAHNYSKHFGEIENLLVGDKIIFLDVKGNSFVYEVAGIEELEEDAVEEMESGEWELTLFTCTYTGRTRVTVRCSKVE